MRVNDKKTWEVNKKATTVVVFCFVPEVGLFLMKTRRHSVSLKTGARCASVLAAQRFALQAPMRDEQSSRSSGN